MMSLADLREILADAERQGCPDNTRVVLVIPTALRLDKHGKPEVGAYTSVNPQYGRVEESSAHGEEGALPLVIAIQADAEEMDLEVEDAPWEPSALDLKLQRYGLLFGKPNLSALEQVEKKSLKAELAAAGRDPGWE